MPTQPSERILRAVLFTDIVGSTTIAAELGDRRWRELLARHHRILRTELKRFGGKEIDTAGDGFFAVFIQPGAAIRCGVAAVEAVRDLGIDIRASVHFGELEPMDGKLGGIGVHTAARILSTAGPGEIVVSVTTRDLVAGSDFEFADHGTHELKGVPGEVRLLAVSRVDAHPLRRPPDAATAAERRALVPPAIPRGGRRRIMFLGGATAALLLAVAIVVIVASGGSMTPTRKTDTGGSAANQVLAIDVQTGESVVQGTLPRGNVRAEEIEVGEGSVWLIRNPVLVKIDSGDGSFTTLGVSNAGLGIAGTSGLAVGFGRVWTFSGDTLMPVDAATFHAPKPIRIPEAEGTRALATGFGSVWLGTDSGDLLRVDPETHEATRIAVGEVAGPLTVGSDAVWVLDDFAGEVIRVNHKTNDVSARIPLSSGLDRIAVGEGHVWVLDTVAGVLTPIDERDGDIRQVIAIGDGATDVAVGFGSVWVSRGGTVLRIDPLTGHIQDRLRLGSIAIVRLAVDLAGGRLWLDLAA